MSRPEFRSQPRYLGLREDKEAADVVREVPRRAP